MYISGYKGYGSAGASHKKRSTKGFTAISGSPREDIDDNNYTLRQRGRLMYMGNAIASSAVKTHRTNTVGLGLHLNPRPDMAYLGLSQEEAAEWVNNVKREFSLWADKKITCDATGMNNFYELQQLLLTSWLTSGDVFVLVQSTKTDKFKPYSLRLKAVEADLVATPDTAGGIAGLSSGKNPGNGNVIHDGVEVDKSGMVVAYHLRSTYPFEATDEETEFTRLEAFGDRTGLPNVLQLMAAERPGQYRGVSYLAPVIIPLLQTNRYTESELTAALVDSFFTVYVQTNTAEGENPFNEATPGDDDYSNGDPNDYEMGPGQVNFLQPGENVVKMDARRPAGGFPTFIDAICAQVGAALEIPKDILLKSFNASYSASRGALLEAWKSFRMYRTWFVNDFCNPVYELWLTEAVAKGRVNAPGFFSDPAVRAAWLDCEWIGPSQGMLDPIKEIQAEAMACENGFSTHEDSALRINGSDFTSNVEQLAREAELLKAAGITPTQTEQAPAPTPEEEPEETEAEQEENEDQTEEETRNFLMEKLKGFFG